MKINIKATIEGDTKQVAAFIQYLQDAQKIGRLIFPSPDGTMGVVKIKNLEKAQ